MNDPLEEVVGKGNQSDQPGVTPEATPFWKKNVLLEKPTRAFVALNVMDLVMTFFLLNNGGFRESNKVADFFLDRWGIAGMVWYKIIFVMVIVVIAQVVARHRINSARMLLYFGCAVMGGVVLYSAYLYFKYGQPVEEAIGMLF